MAGKEAKIEPQREYPDVNGDYLDDSELVDHLVAGGASRLTAERIVAIARGGAEPGRARRHTQARR
jgi:hypothetical protein